MSKLLQRLSDTKNSGVYRVRHDRDIRDCLRGASHEFARALLPGTGKDGILDAFAAALVFPEWFGRNWDALEDCLGDLSWRTTSGQILLIEGWEGESAEDLQTLLEILQAAAGGWRGRNRVFIAAFVDPLAQLALPVLYNEKSRQ